MTTTLEKIHNIETRVSVASRQLARLAATLEDAGNPKIAKDLRFLSDYLADVEQDVRQAGSGYVDEVVGQANESQRAVNQFVTTMINAVAEGKIK